jgi:hypothetical protein
MSVLGQEVWGSSMQRQALHAAPPIFSPFPLQVSFAPKLTCTPLCHKSRRPDRKDRPSSSRRYRSKTRLQPDAVEAIYLYTGVDHEMRFYFLALSADRSLHLLKINALCANRHKYFDKYKVPNSGLLE